MAIAISVFSGIGKYRSGKAVKSQTIILWACSIVLLLLQPLTGGAQAIVSIASMNDHSLFVKSDGSLWGGDAAHQFEQLKAGKFKNRSLFDSTNNREPVGLIVSNGVIAVDVENGEGCSFFIKKDGSLWAMGSNAGGFLGDGTFNTPDHPIQIVPSGVTAIAGGEFHLIFLKDDGSLWGFGWNRHGELGDGLNGNYDVIYRPQKIVDGGVVAIATGDFHSLFIKNDGSLWGMGNNVYGQLGMGTNQNFYRPQMIVASGVASVAAGRKHSLFIKKDGSLWAIGLNDFGQIGDCDFRWVFRPKLIVSNNVAAVYAGDSGSLFLKNDGSLWAMGINWYTDYGEGIEFSSHCPIELVAADKAAPVADYYYNAKLKSCASILANPFNHDQVPADGHVGINDRIQASAAASPGYNWISIELLLDGNVRLTYIGDSGVNYALDRSASLMNPNWIPQTTNTAGDGGVLVITNTPDTATDNFWRIRSVQ